MIKRGWKLPNPSHFTYTSIVQPIWQAKVLYKPFYTAFKPVFCMTQDDAPPQPWPIPATGLFWSWLSALDTPTNVFSTHLWSFWYQIHLNQTLLSILKLQKYLQRVWWAGWLGTNWSSLLWFLGTAFKTVSKQSLSVDYRHLWMDTDRRSQRPL